MQRVKMFSTASCPYCIQAKRLLQSKGVSHIDEVRVDLNHGAHPHDGTHWPAHRAADLYW